MATRPGATKSRRRPPPRTGKPSGRGTASAPKPRWQRDRAGKERDLISAFDRLGLPRADDAVRAAVGQRLEHGPHSRGSK